MNFTLTKVIDGEVKLFSIQKFLEILGDTTNDEMQLDGEAFRISSFIPIGGSVSGQTYIFCHVNLSVNETGQEEFILPEVIVETNSLQLIINGVSYEYGNLKSYHISDTRLYWHGDFSLEASDLIFLKYVKSI